MSLFAEHRLVFHNAEGGNIESIDADIDKSLDQWQEYMDSQLKDIHKKLELHEKDSDRKESVQRERELILQKIEQIRKMGAASRTELVNEHNRMAGDVKELLIYAKYQIEQAKEFKGAPELDVEHIINKGWNQYSFKADKDSVLSMSYIRKEANSIGKLSGTIDFGPSAVESKMDGTFTIRHWQFTPDSDHYIIVSMHPGFNGTITLSSEGKKQVIDVAGKGRRIEQDKKKPDEKKDTTENKKLSTLAEKAGFEYDQKTKQAQKKLSFTEETSFVQDVYDTEELTLVVQNSADGSISDIAFSGYPEESNESGRVQRIAQKLTALATRKSLNDLPAIEAEVREIIKDQDAISAMEFLIVNEKAHLNKFSLAIQAMLLEAKTDTDRAAEFLQQASDFAESILEEDMNKKDAMEMSSHILDVYTEALQDPILINENIKEALQKDIVALFPQAHDSAAEVHAEQGAAVAIRAGDFFSAIGEKKNAIAWYQKALEAVPDELKPLIQEKIDAVEK